MVLCALLWLTALALSPTASRAQGQCRYTVSAVLRGPLAPECGTLRVTVLGLNDIGHAVGYVENCAGDDASRRPFVWTEELGVKVLQLPFPAVRGQAVAINNVADDQDGLGQIAATLTHIGNEGDRAYHYNNGVWTEIPPTQGFTFSVAHGINDAGQITGSRLTNAGLVGYRWQNGVFTDLSSRRGELMLALDINTAGHVVGELVSRPHASYWNGRNVIDLGTIFNGASAFALAINDADEIAGGAMVADACTGESTLHAFFLAGRNVTDIGVPSVADTSMAIDLNDAGQALVRCFTFQPRLTIHTFLWQHGAMQSLAELVDVPPGVTIGGVAEAINSLGQIAVNGWKDGAQVGLILSPVDSLTADLNFDCVVDANDVAALLAHWGPCDVAGACPYDLASSATFAPPGDGVVDGADLAYVLGSWTR